MPRRRVSTDIFDERALLGDKARRAFEQGARGRGFDHFSVKWDDLQGPAAMGNASAALDFDPVGDTGFHGFCFSSTTTDTVYFNFQTRHGWKPNTECRAHVHFTPLADPAVAEKIAFNYAFAWSHRGIRTPKPATWTTGEVVHTVQPTTDWDVPIILHLFSTTPSAAYPESSILKVKLWRKHDSANDTYTTSKGYGTTASNVEFEGLDVHIQIAKFGTTSEFTEP